MNADINIDHFTPALRKLFATIDPLTPWFFFRHLEDLIKDKIAVLDEKYECKDNIAIHRTAHIEPHAIIKAPAIIGPKAFIASHAYLRGGTVIDEQCVVGPGVEVKSSVVLARTAIAHFNFIGDSIIGSDVNMEAGAVIANHYNERVDKTIFVNYNGRSFPIPLKKFGAIIGDGSRIGANAVLSPGTILPPNTMVNRLALIEQNPV